MVYTSPNPAKLWLKKPNGVLDMTKTMVLFWPLYELRGGLSSNGKSDRKRSPFPESPELRPLNQPCLPPPTCRMATRQEILAFRRLCAKIQFICISAPLFWYGPKTFRAQDCRITFCCSAVSRPSFMSTIIIYTYIAKPRANE